MQLSAKPVRKCHGCGLNQADRCGVYASPRVQWQKHTVCPGYKNEKVLKEYETRLARMQTDAKLAKKMKRKLAAKQRGTVEHQDADRHVLMAVRG